MFTHEVQTYNTVFHGLLSALRRQNLDSVGRNIANSLEKRFNIFKSYTAYFNAAASKNESLKIEPIDIKKQINSFLRTIEHDRERAQIQIPEPEYYDDYQFISCPMHPSEWQSMLLNFYSNSKKAIKRKKNSSNDEYIGKIKIIVGLENDKIYLEFLDNGDGIAEENRERIFNAFFTTSTPASFDINENNEMTGTGLGLRIVSDIIEAYNGAIYVSEPTSGYNTNIRIEIPKATLSEIEEYE
jgi:signal transduction histidine kinase